MRMLPDGCIDMTVTSPPYDGLRQSGWDGFTVEVFRAIAQELWRLTCPAGVVAWVIVDQSNGGYSGTSFRQALYLMETGFRLHEIPSMSRKVNLYAGPRYGKVQCGF